MQFFCIGILLIGVNVKCGSLLILLLLCLALLSMPKHWGFRYVLRYLSWRSIRTVLLRVLRLFYFSLPICWLALGINNVYADATPEPTWYPFYETQAPGEFINNECPDGMPAGYGVKTPSPLWLNYCSQCLPPEGSDYEWGDPPEGFEPTATLVYPTPRPTDYPDNEDTVFTSAPVDSFKLDGIGDYVNTFEYGSRYVFDEVDVNASTTATYRGFDVGVDNSDHDYAFFFNLDLDKTKTACTSIYCSHYGKYRLRFKNYGADNVNVKIFVAGLLIWEEDISYQATELFDMEQFGQCENITFWRDMDIAIEITGSYGFYGTDFQFRDESYFQSFCGVHSRHISFEITPGLYDPDPGDSYCDEIQEEDPGGNEEGNEYFSVPGFEYGDGVCFNVPSFTIDMEWTHSILVLGGAGLDDIVWQGFEVCFIPVRFGALALFGFSMDLDVMAGLMSAVLLIRMITRS